MQDRSPLRLSFRIARHEPLYALASVLLLALGIAALGAMLALYRGTFAQPPPLSNWERLVVLRGVTAQSNRLPLSFPDFEDLRRDVPAFADLALTRAATVTLEAGESAPQRIAAARVTPNLAAVLGVALTDGAGFDVAVGQAADQVVISERLWRGTLAGAPIDALKLRIGGRAVDVVGVLPAGLRFPTPDIDLWLPLAPVGNEARRDYAFTTPWGVLQPGATIDDARGQIAARVALLAAAFPQSHAGLAIEPHAIAADLLAPHRPVIAVFALVGLMVFVAVAGNVAALAAARELSRRGATTTRLVLGANHRRLFGDAVRGALALAAVAAVAGALLALTIVRAAEASDAEMFTALRATVDAGVLAGTGAGALLLLAAQLAPSWWMQRRIALATPGAGGLRAMTVDRSTVRAAGAIVALQLAMSFATVGTLVLANLALAALERTDLGFATQDRYSVALGVPELDHAATIAGFEAAIDEVARMPGVATVAAISRLPLLRGASSVGLVPSSVGLPGDAALPVDARLVVGAADEALGLRLVRGRFIGDEDRQGAPRAVVVDRRFVQQWLPDRDPIGARLRLQIDPTIEWHVVGVIEPVRWRTFEDGEAPALLVAAAQFDNIAPMRNAQLVWRGRFDASTGVEPLREALRRGMPLLSADTPRPLDAIVADASGQARIAARLLRLLTGIALLLALLGVGALLLYRHERQRRAVGIRLCLGASRGRVVARALADSLVLAMCGAVAGAALVVALRQLPAAARLLPADGLASAMLAAAAVVALLAIVGGIAPAWRIARLEPRKVLHDAG
ncbi:MAG TPA: ABC transporter permease [Xanthomonadales bacterium]|nr:ABC transporter permease [Xanthomonadales bacterium]